MKHHYIKIQPLLTEETFLKIELVEFYIISKPFKGVAIVSGTRVTRIYVSVLI